MREREFFSKLLIRNRSVEMGRHRIYFIGRAAVIFFFLLLHLVSTFNVTSPTSSTATTILIKDENEKLYISLQRGNSSFKVIAPSYQYRLQIICNLTVNDVVEIEPEFTNDGSASEIFHGSGIVRRYSLFNYLRIGLIQNLSKATATKTTSSDSIVKCLIKVVNRSCECGWQYQVYFIMKLG